MRRLKYDWIASVIFIACFVLMFHISFADDTCIFTETGEGGPYTFTGSFNLPNQEGVFYVDVRINNDQGAVVAIQENVNVGATSGSVSSEVVVEVNQGGQVVTSGETSQGTEKEVVLGSEVKGGTFSVEMAEEKDVIVVSESIGSSDANNLIGVATPMMHMESYGWSRHFFTTGLRKQWAPADSGIVEVLGHHGILANAGIMAGELLFFSDTTSVTTDLVESLVEGAQNLAQIPSSDTTVSTVVFTIE